MLNIQQGVISLNRGDDVNFSVEIADENGQSYEMQTGDELVFCVRKSAAGDSPVLLTARSVTNVISLCKDDTRGMEVGRYSAAIRLIRAGGEEIIVYPKLASHGRERDWNNFVLDPEVVE